MTIMESAICIARPFSSGQGHGDFQPLGQASILSVEQTTVTLDEALSLGWATLFVMILGLQLKKMEMPRNI